MSHALLHRYCGYSTLNVGICNITFVVIPLGCKKVHYLHDQEILTDMPAQPFCDLMGHCVGHCDYTVYNLARFYPVSGCYHELYYVFFILQLHLIM